MLVSKDGRVIYNNAIGMADAINGVEMKPNQVFRIGSITKQFTAAAILQLVEQGKIRLDDPVSAYMQDLPEDKTSITIGELLTHTSGLGNQNEIEGWKDKVNLLETKPAIRDSIFQMFLDAPLGFSAGTAYKYSNFGYYMLGAVIENVSGMGYQNYLTKHIFQPLEMHQTSYEYGSNRPTVVGHSSSEGELIPAESLDMRIPFAGGGLLSTVQDLHIWNKAISRGKIIGSELLASAHAAHQKADGKSIPYGYGWMIGKLNGEETIKHDGIINGFTSFALYVAAHDVFVAVLTNCDCSQNLEYITSKFAAAAIGMEEERGGDLVLSQEDLIKFSGLYEDVLGNRKHITLQDGVLKYHSKGGAKISLAAVDATNFLFAKDVFSRLVFSRDELGKITMLQLRDLGLGETYMRVDDENIVLNAVALSDQQLESLVGAYEFPVGFTLEIVEEDNRLYGQVQGDRKELNAVAADKLYAVHDDIQLEFGELEGEVVVTMRQAFEMQAKKKK